MLFATSTAVTVYVKYTSLKVGKTGLTVTVSLVRDGTSIFTGSSATEVDSTNHPGLYSFSTTTGNTATQGSYAMSFHTADTTVDMQDFEDAFYCQSWINLINTALPNVAPGSNDGLPTADASNQVKANITAITSGIIAAASFASGALDAVWSTATRALTDKAGFALSSAGVQAIWDALTSALTTVNSIGKLLVTNIDATISSRLASASYTAPDNADIATILTRTDVATSTREAAATFGADTQAALTAQGYTTTRAGYLDVLNGIVQAIWDKATSALTTVGSIGKLLVTNIDTAISSRLATSGYTAPDNADIVTILTRTDVATSTRLATSGYTAPDNAGIATAVAGVSAIFARTDVATSTRLAAADVETLRGTSSNGNTSTTIKLNGGSSVDGLYNGQSVILISGTGQGQADRTITAYAGATGIATVTPAWVTIPDVTTGFVVSAMGGGGGGAAPSDPWLTMLPGSYTPGEAGYILPTRATLGAGSKAIPITIESGILPIDGVDVWATTDLGGSNVVARGQTDDFGLVTFYLDPGTFYVWIQLSGYQATNPQTLVVS